MTCSSVPLTLLSCVAPRTQAAVVIERQFNQVVDFLLVGGVADGISLFGVPIRDRDDLIERAASGDTVADALDSAGPRNARGGVGIGQTSEQRARGSGALALALVFIPVEAHDKFALEGVETDADVRAFAGGLGKRLEEVIGLVGGRGIKIVGLVVVERRALEEFRDEGIGAADALHEAEALERAERGADGLGVALQLIPACPAAHDAVVVDDAGGVIREQFGIGERRRRDAAEDIRERAGGGDARAIVVVTPAEGGDEAVFPKVALRGECPALDLAAGAEAASAGEERLLGHRVVLELLRGVIKHLNRRGERLVPALIAIEAGRLRGDTLRAAGLSQVVFAHERGAERLLRARDGEIGNEAESGVGIAVHEAVATSEQIFIPSLECFRQ